MQSDKPLGSEGPGSPDCPHCQGTGVVPLPNENSPHPPRYRRCRCVLHKDILANVERGLPGLSKASPVKHSPLLSKMGENLWVTASPEWFKAHLRHVAIRQPPTWFFKVVSDADLMTAWLASVALEGKDILDPDATKVSLKHLTLVDLIVPPQLLIIRTGVKASRNVATPEVFLETLAQREHRGLPTWVWDQPTWEIHSTRVYSEEVGRYLASWKRIRVMGRGVEASPQATEGFTDMSLPIKGRPTLSDTPTQAKPKPKPKRQQRKTRNEDSNPHSDDLLTDFKGRALSLYGDK